MRKLQSFLFFTIAMILSVNVNALASPASRPTTQPTTKRAVQKVFPDTRILGEWQLVKLIDNGKDVLKPKNLVMIFKFRRNYSFTLLLLHKMHEARPALVKKAETTWKFLSKGKIIIYPPKEHKADNPAILYYRMIGTSLLASEHKNGRKALVFKKVIP